MTLSRSLRYLIPIPVLAAAALIYFADPAPKVRRKPAFFELTSTGKSSGRPVYPFSVVPGGIYDRGEAEKAVKLDPVVAKHYVEQGVDVANLRTVNNTKSKQGYVSYRVGDRIYWTKKKVEIEPGEVVLTDGVHKIRGRCGNMISDKPKSPVLHVEPPAKQMNEPDPSLKPSLDPSSDSAAPTPVVPKIALERDSHNAGSLHAYVAASVSGAGSGSGSGNGGIGASGFGGLSSGVGGSGGGGRSGSGGGGGGAAGGGGGAPAGGGGAAISEAGSSSSTPNGATYAMAAANTISGSGKFGSEVSLRETANGTNSESWLSGMVSSLFGTATPNVSGAGSGSGQDGSNLLGSAGSGLGGSSLTGGPVDVKVLSVSDGQTGAGSGAAKGPVHPFSSEANGSAKLPAGNPSESNGGGASTSSAVSAASDTLAKRRENVRPDGATGTSVSGEQPFSVRPTAEVPEPSTYLLVGTALTALFLRRRRSAAR